jgi:transketolase
MSFRWQVVEVDGHDHERLIEVLDAQRPLDAQPLCVVAHTVKGKGVSFMEHSVLWHYRTARDQELLAARAELGVAE